MNQRIILTQPAGSVSIVCPSTSVLHWMGNGGRWGRCGRGWIDGQIERSIAAGHPPDSARRFVRAMAFGGCTTAEALAIIRDRDCGHRGTGIEIWNVSDVPADRWFRDAWRRLPAGGPISIDMVAARQIQAQRMAMAVEDWNRYARREDDQASLLRPTNGPATIELERPRLRHMLLAARTPEQIKAVWPEELPRIT